MDVSDVAEPQPTRPRPQVRPSTAPTRLAVVGRRARQDADRGRAADVRIRGVPAVGHRDRDRPRPERAGERVRGPPRRHDDDRRPGRRRSTPCRHALTTSDTVPAHRARSRRAAPPSRWSREGDRHRPHRDADDRRRQHRGRRRREVRLEEGPRPLPGDADAGPARQRRDRRTPHHLRPTVLRRRQAPHRRRDHRHHPRRPLRVPGHGPADRAAERLRGGRHDRPDEGDAHPHVVPSEVDRP